MISEDQNWNPRGWHFSFEQGELCKDLVHLYTRQQGARHFQSKTAEMPKEGEKYHYLLAEKILIISIKGRHCIHRDNISTKACTKVWGSAMQSTNQSLEWQWMGCNTYCDTAQESGGCPHQYFSVLISTSVSSPIHHCAPRRCLQVTHTQLRPPGAHTGVSTRNCWLLHCKLTCYGFPFHFRAKKCIQEYVGLLRLPITFVKIHLLLWNKSKKRQNHSQETLKQSQQWQVPHLSSHRRKSVL